MPLIAVASWVWYGMFGWMLIAQVGLPGCRMIAGLVLIRRCFCWVVGTLSGFGQFPLLVAIVLVSLPVMKVKHMIMIDAISSLAFLRFVGLAWSRWVVSSGIWRPMGVGGLRVGLGGGSSSSGQLFVRE